jgi:hypothetical protein
MHQTGEKDSRWRSGRGREGSGGGGGRGAGRERPVSRIRRECAEGQAASAALSVRSVVVNRAEMASITFIN